MSQFILLTGDCQTLDNHFDVHVKLVQPDQPFLVHAAHELFPTARGACWTVVATETGLSDTLFRTPFNIRSTHHNMIATRQNARELCR